MRVFCDSSAFAKRFVEESGSNEVEALCARASELGLSSLCVPEVLSALNRRRRERTLTRGQYEESKRCLLADCRDADVIHLTDAVMASTVLVLESGPVRAMDALHIGCAMVWGAELFVSSDEQQLVATRRAGLRTRRV
jgi:uncharacterized protein